ncbi:hypothetical protein [Marinobacter caseinilyticus]|uniref:hypothetical protein n=1 Tax=Marinobacter caseinilyticus TaxID=2692195 RepID=UPI001A9460E2|nr:hypothetical protein [Marinobacter caseinilyticus]
MKMYAQVILMAAALVVSGTSLAKPPHSDQLPPGLQKNVEQGKPLPPGWEKKLHEGDRMDADLYYRGRVRPIGDNREIVEIEDQIFTVISDTREIIDIMKR